MKPGVHARMAQPNNLYHSLEPKVNFIKTTTVCGEENAIEINNDCCTSVLAACCMEEKTKTGGTGPGPGWEIEGGNWQ